MNSKEFFEEVYAARTVEETQAVYAAHASHYDDTLDKAEYMTPRRMAEAVANHIQDREIAILDFGCGTGLSGEALAAEGFTRIDGYDVSQPMLDQAAQKAVYQKLVCGEPGDPLPTGYGLVFACGAVSVGAAPASVLAELVETLSQGGFLALSYNDHTLHDPAYSGALKQLTDDGLLRTIYEEHGPHLPTLNLNATVYLFEKA
ncbi:MAG: methyltransferase [Pseudomonadota bacterium]